MLEVPKSPEMRGSTKNLPGPALRPYWKPALHESNGGAVWPESDRLKCIPPNGSSENEGEGVIIYLSETGTDKTTSR